MEGLQASCKLTAKSMNTSIHITPEHGISSLGMDIQIASNSTDAKAFERHSLEFYNSICYNHATDTTG